MGVFSFAPKKYEAHELGMNGLGNTWVRYILKLIRIS